MTERTSVEHDGDRGSGEFTEDQWREFMMAVVSKTSRKIPVATVRGWVERMTEAFYDSVEALSSATALDLQEAAGVPHLVGKIIVQTAKDLNDLTEDEASKTSDAKVKVRTSQNKFGGSSGDVDVDEDDEEVTVSAKLDPAPAEGVGVSLEKVQMPIDDGSMDGSGVHHPDEASEEDLPEGDYEEQDEETADEGVDDEESPQKSATDSALESVGQSVMSMQSALMSQVAMQKVFMEAQLALQQKKDSEDGRPGKLVDMPKLEMEGDKRPSIKKVMVFLQKVVVVRSEAYPRCSGHWRRLRPRVRCQ